MPEIKTNTELVPHARVDGSTAVAALRGEIDLHNSPSVRTALLAILNNHHPRKLVLNLSEVPYMDSSAIAVLVESLQKIRKLGGRIYLTNLQPRVKGLLEIARLDAIFGMCKDEAEALAQ
jgi:anti-anti-sigma factor